MSASVRAIDAHRQTRAQRERERGGRLFFPDSLEIQQRHAGATAFLSLTRARKSWQHENSPSRQKVSNFSSTRPLPYNKKLHARRVLNESAQWKLFTLYIQARALPCISFLYPLLLLVIDTERQQLLSASFNEFPILKKARARARGLQSIPRIYIYRLRCIIRLYTE